MVGSAQSVCRPVALGTVRWNVDPGAVRWPVDTALLGGPLPPRPPWGADVRRCRIWVTAGARRPRQRALAHRDPNSTFPSRTPSARCRLRPVGAVFGPLEPPSARWCRLRPVGAAFGPSVPSSARWSRLRPPSRKPVEPGEPAGPRAGWPLSPPPLREASSVPAVRSPALLRLDGWSRPLVGRSSRSSRRARRSVGSPGPSLHQGFGARRTSCAGLVSEAWPVDPKVRVRRGDLVRRTSSCQVRPPGAIPYRTSDRGDTGKVGRGCRGSSFRPSRSRPGSGLSPRGLTSRTQERSTSDLALRGRFEEPS